MQIGGGVRVGDAFQAIVGFGPIAIWVRQFCVEISQGEASCFVDRTREIRNSRSGDRKAKHASRLGREWTWVRRAERVASGWTVFRFQAPPVDFETIWSDYLLRLVAAGGGGSMSCKIIGIVDLGSIANDSVLNIPASNDALSDALEEADTPPLARAPDRPSSTR